jgi:hypothetical protein
VVDSAEDGNRHDAGVAREAVSVLARWSRHLLGRHGNPRPEGGVRPRSVVEVSEREERSAYMVLGERDEEVEALSSKSSDESLAEGVGLWGPGGSPEDLDAEVFDALSNFRREQNVAVEEDEAVGMLEGERFAELL